MRSSASNGEVVALLRNLHIPVILMDSEFRVVAISHQAASWDGRSVDEFIGRDWFELYPVHQNPHLPVAIREAMATRTLRIVEIRYVNRENVERWCEVTLQPFQDGLLFSSRDITEQKHAEKLLQDAKTRYQLTTSASDDIIYDWDCLTDGLEWNDLGQQVFGCKKATCSWWSEQVHPEDRERVTATLTEAVESDANYWKDEYRIRKADGQYAVCIDRCFFTRDEHGKALRGFGAIMDVTAQRESEQTVKQLEADLIRLARASAMGTMASTLAHEINQPLTAVIQYLGGCERLLEGGGSREEIAEALERSKTAAERVADVIRRVRTLSVKGEVAKQEVCVTAAVPEAISVVKMEPDAARMGLELDIENHIGVYADPVQFQQVLINLLGNAAHAMRDVDHPRVRISARREGAEGVISIKDNGPGIAEKTRQRLFESFFSTKPGGMGIGLPVSRTIVESHGGSLACLPSEEGAHFEIRLPLVLEDDKVAVSA